MTCKCHLRYFAICTLCNDDDEVHHEHVVINGDIAYLMPLFTEILGLNVDQNPRILEMKSPRPHPISVEPLTLVQFEWD